MMIFIKFNGKLRTSFLMKSFLPILLFLFTTCSIGICNAQSEWQRGFKIGYKEGYCYGDFGCIAPVAPISSPSYNESPNSYTDGYNSGFKRGLEDSNNEETTKDQKTAFAPNYDLINQYLQVRENSQKLLAEYYENEIIKKQALINSIKKFHESYKPYPEIVINGWHKVYVTNNYDNIIEAKVLVKENKIVKYIEDNWKHVKLESSSNINNAKSLITIEKNTTQNYEVFLLII